MAGVTGHIGEPVVQLVETEIKQGPEIATTLLLRMGEFLAPEVIWNFKVAKLSIAQTMAS